MTGAERRYGVIPAERSESRDEGVRSVGMTGARNTATCVDARLRAHDVGYVDAAGRLVLQAPPFHPVLSLSKDG